MHAAASLALFEAEVQTLSPEFARRRRWLLHSVTHPTIDCSFTEQDRTTLRVRLICDDWNDLPPSITLHAADGAMLEALPPNPTGVFNSSAHPATGRPFICMRGSREYHTHPSHVGDLWDNLKNSSAYTLGGILTQVWHAWRKGSG